MQFLSRLFPRGFRYPYRNRSTSFPHLPLTIALHNKLSLPVQTNLLPPPLPHRLGGIMPGPIFLFRFLLISGLLYRLCISPYLSDNYIDFCCVYGFLYSQCESLSYLSYEGIIKHFYRVFERKFYARHTFIYSPKE